MDYESILKGRRRNWDPLKSDEVREAEREEERRKRREEHEKKDKGGGSSRGTFGMLRTRRREREYAEDMERFRKAVRQGVILFSVFLLALAGWLAFNAWREARERALYEREFERYQTVLTGGEVVDDLSTPAAAFATWRSAWLQEDLSKVISIYSPQHFESLTTGNKTRSDLEVEYRLMRQRGLLQHQVDMAANFEGAEIIRAPSRPWRNQELAIFRSAAFLRPGSGPDGVRYVVTFSYDSQSGEWRFADMREAHYFNVRWEMETQIQPVRGGARAIRYDEEGNRLENPAAANFPSVSR